MNAPEPAEKSAMEAASSKSLVCRVDLSSFPSPFSSVKDCRRNGKRADRQHRFEMQSFVYIMIISADSEHSLARNYRADF